MTRKLRILIVEDEEAIRTGLVDVLIYHGYEVEYAADGTDGLKMALTGQYDLILLDVMLPGINGFDICNQLRGHDREQAIIMLTARSGDEDIIEGLSSGADDYVAKPFSVAQLVLRIKAVLRRSSAPPEQALHLQLGTLAIDTQNLSGLREDTPCSFTRREMELLQYLAASPSQAVSRSELLHKIWGYAKDADIETRTVDIHIAKLRRKIELNPSDPQHLITVRGVGIRLDIHPASD